MQVATLGTTTLDTSYILGRDGGVRNDKAALGSISDDHIKLSLEMFAVTI